MTIVLALAVYLILVLLVVITGELAKVVDRVFSIADDVHIVRAGFQEIRTTLRDTLSTLERSEKCRR